MLNRILDALTRAIPTTHEPGQGNFHAGPRGPYSCCDETCRQPGRPEER
jgi:hypothetical protein